MSSGGTRDTKGGRPEAFESETTIDRPFLPLTLNTGTPEPFEAPATVIDHRPPSQQEQTPGPSPEEFAPREAPTVAATNAVAVLAAREVRLARERTSQNLPVQFGGSDQLFEDVPTTLSPSRSTPRLPRPRVRTAELPAVAARRSASASATSLIVGAILLGLVVALASWTLGRRRAERASAPPPPHAAPLPPIPPAATPPSPTVVLPDPVVIRPAAPPSPKPLVRKKRPAAPKPPEPAPGAEPLYPL